MGGTLVVRFRAKIRPIESEEVWVEEEKFLRRIRYALPADTQKQLTNWYMKHYLRMRSLPSVNVSGIVLYPDDVREEIRRIFEEAREEFERIVSDLPEELRGRVGFQPIVADFTPVQEWFPEFRRELTQEVMKDFGKRVAKFISRAEDLSEEVKSELISKLTAGLEDLIAGKLRVLEEQRKLIEEIVSELESLPPGRKNVLMKVREELKRVRAFGDVMMDDAAQFVRGFEEELDRGILKVLSEVRRGFARREPSA
ncbi:MAG: hypothetical protein QXK42_03705 [Candidatus Korarchaeum sp.]